MEGLIDLDPFRPAFSHEERNARIRCPARDARPGQKAEEAREQKPSRGRHPGARDLCGSPGEGQTGGAFLSATKALGSQFMTPSTALWLRHEFRPVFRARFKIAFRPRRSTSAGAVRGLRTTREWTCPSGCGGEGPSPLSLALRDTPSRIASGSLRGAGTGPPSGSLCCRGGPPLGARNAARNFILKCALRPCGGDLLEKWKRSRHNINSYTKVYFVLDPWKLA